MTSLKLIIFVFSLRHAILRFLAQFPPNIIEICIVSETYNSEFSVIPINSTT